MKSKLCLLGALVAAVCQFAPIALAQEAPKGTEADTPAATPGQFKLSLDEQLKLRAAQQKAAEDADVKAALAKRDKAIEEFRAAMHKSMVKSNPAMEAILAKIAVGNSPGF